MICAYFIVESASFVAVSVGIPKVVIGATVIAFGTSVPELATSIDAVRKGHMDLARALFFLWYFLSSEKIGWREGAVLLSIYSVFLAISFSGYRF